MHRQPDCLPAKVIMMDTVFLVSFVFVGLSMVLSSFSAFYMYKFTRSYEGKFRKPMDTLFIVIVLFALFTIQVGFSLVITPSVSLLISVLLSMTAILASALLLAVSKSVYKAETGILIETLKSQKSFLQQKSKLIEEKFMKRKISEDMFKQMLLDLEKDIIDTDAKIITLKGGSKGRGN